MKGGVSVTGSAAITLGVALASTGTVYTLVVTRLSHGAQPAAIVERGPRVAVQEPVYTPRALPPLVPMRRRPAVTVQEPPGEALRVRRLQG